MTKVCFKCGEKKEITEFYSHNGMADKHLNKCKECTKRDVKIRRIENPEKLKEYEKKRNNNEKRKAVQALKSKEFRKINPDKYRAQTMVNNAVRDKKLKKPLICEICGAVAKLEGHHEDYTYPLNVVWLCVRCHRHVTVASGKIVDVQEGPERYFQYT